MVGALLVAVSVYPLGLMMREWWAVRQLHSGFEFQPEYEKMQASLEKHQVAISDSYADGKYKPEDRRVGQAKIKIDGKDFSDLGQIEIRPYYQNANRYHGWAVLGQLRDLKNGRQWIAVGQRTLGDTLLTGRKPDLQSDEFRILLVDSNGQVDEQRFGLEQRTAPLYRMLFVRYLYPTALGFHSQVLQGWPTLLYPILFPIITSIAGMLMFAWWAFGRAIRV